MLLPGPAAGIPELTLGTTNAPTETVSLPRGLLHNSAVADANAWHELEEVDHRVNVPGTQPIDQAGRPLAGRVVPFGSTFPNCLSNEQGILHADGTAPRGATWQRPPKDARGPRQPSTSQVNCQR